MSAVRQEVRQSQQFVRSHENVPRNSALECSAKKKRTRTGYGPVKTGTSRFREGTKPHRLGPFRILIFIILLVLGLSYLGVIVCCLLESDSFQIIFEIKKNLRKSLKKYFLILILGGIHMVLKLKHSSSST